MTAFFALIACIAVHGVLAVNVSVDFLLGNGTVDRRLVVIDGVVQEGFQFDAADTYNETAGFLLAPDVVNVTLSLIAAPDEPDIEFLMWRDVIGGESKPHHEPLDGADLSYDLPGLCVIFYAHCGVFSFFGSE